MTPILRRLTLVLAAALAVACPDRSGGPQPSSAPTPVPTQADAGPPPGDADTDSSSDADVEADGAPGLDGAPLVDAEDEIDPMTLDGSVSTSIGGPSGGSLEGGVPFPARAPGIIRNPRRLNPGGHYGTVEMIQTLIRAAAVVEEAMPGGHPVVVNDLSFREGGPIPHHGSHQSGRDVDVLFYLLDREGEPRPAKGVPLDPRGRGWDFDDLADPEDDKFVKIDAKRTWRYLQALVEQEDSRLQRIFVAEHLRTILMNEARRAKAPRAARRRVGLLTCQPGSPHDDHFHFRFFCTTEDLQQGCEDSLPLYPWRRKQLAAAEVEPVLFRRRRRRRRSKTVSPAEAAAKAGKMHWKVIAFLRERESWSENPHPGRPYCR